MSKNELKKFIDKVYQRVHNFEEYGPDELNEIYEFLNSDEFYNKAIELKNNCENQGEYQKEFNEKLILVVSEKLKELTLKCEHNISIKTILRGHDIIMD
ncbi:MAG TPA: hypothetical protein VIO43_12230 [Lutibacter sp.]